MCRVFVKVLEWNSDFCRGHQANLLMQGTQAADNRHDNSGAMKMEQNIEEENHWYSYITTYILLHLRTLFYIWPP